MNSASVPPLAVVDQAADESIASALQALAAPGSFFSGSERVALAAHVRGIRGLDSSGTATNLPAPLAEAAARIAVEAISTRPDHIAAWQADGRDVLAYVELVAVVALITSVDAYRIGLNTPLDALPEPLPGQPVPVIAADASKSNAWVPTVGIALAPTALSALPNEKATKDGLGTSWYLDDKVIHQYDVEPGRELTRPQMELVASRTSWLNECFF